MEGAWPRSALPDKCRGATTANIAQKQASSWCGDSRSSQTALDGSHKHATASCCDLVVISAAPTVFAGEVDFRMDNAHVSC